MMNDNEIFDGFVGGGYLSADRIRQDVSEPKDLVASSPLDKRLARLLALHPEARLAFRNPNLATLNTETKEDLLQDIQDILGISPLKNE